MHGTLTSVDPATGSPVGAVDSTPVSEIPAIVRRARAAGHGWREAELETREGILKKASPILAAAAREIGELISREMGKPVKEAVGEATHAGDSLNEAVEEIAEALAPEVIEDDKVHSSLHFDALGIAACITPWNFPVLMPQDIVIPALMAGNAVVLKPSEKTPLCATRWAECLQEVLPEGLLQVVHGDEEQGKALVAADVDLIAFVGSRAAGISIMREAAGGLKRLILELGGKDALVVLEDADLQAAVAFAARNCFRNAGQVCVSTERIYVHERLAGEFTSLLTERAKAIKQGPGSQEGVEVGPMADGIQQEHVAKLVEDARGRGARVLTGGARGEGAFFQPTVLTGLTHEMRIMREETFGPVACIMPFKDDAEAVRLANDTPFGLGGAVFGAVEHAEAVARRLHTAMVGINKGCGGASGTPWVGAKQSGFGYHSGKQGHRQFAQVRVISRAK